MKRARIVLEVEVPDKVKQITVDENGTIYGWTKSMRMKPDSDLKIWITEKEDNDCPANQFGELNRIQNWERLRVVPKKSAAGSPATVKKKPKEEPAKKVEQTPKFVPPIPYQKKFVRKKKA